MTEIASAAIDIGKPAATQLGSVHSRPNPSTAFQASIN